MDSSTSSLENLSDIIVPESVAFWPLGPGAYLLLLAFLTAALISGYLYYKRYRANRYRKAGLLLLEDAATVHDVSLVLKRVALAAFPRGQVASLYAKEWEDFLSVTCKKCVFSGLLGEAEKKADKKLLDSARLWIRCHDFTGKR